MNTLLELLPALFLIIPALGLMLGDATSLTFEDEVKGAVKTIKDETKKTKDEVVTIKSKQEELIANYDQLGKDTKKAMEDLTIAKNACNDFTVNLKKLETVMLQMKREERMAWGDPIARMLADEETRTYVNAVVRSVCGVKLNDAQTKALGENAPPGSTLINDDLLGEIYDTLSTFGAWSTFAVKRMGTKITKMPVKTARPIALVVDEAAEIADDTNKAGTSVNLEVKKIAVLLNVSSELLEDAEFDVSADVMGDFMEAFAFRLDHMALNANGVANNLDGGMIGAFNSATAAVAGMGSTAVETSTLQDWMAPLIAVDPIVLQRAARWWMHPRSLVRALGVVDGNGRSIFLTAIEAPAAKSIGSILGYPVTLAHAAPSTNAANADVALFGDPNAYVVGIRRDFQIRTSEHHRWNFDQLSFRGIGRAGTMMRRAEGMAVLTLAAA